MTERGLPIVDGAPACPFVAFEDDRDARALAPDHGHRCFAEPRPAPRALAHQEAYCLSSAFPVCPAFQDWARREAAAARPSPSSTRPSPGAVAGSAAAMGAAAVGSARPSEIEPELDPEPEPEPAGRPMPPLGAELDEVPEWDAAAQSDVPPKRNPPRDWAAPPPWAGETGPHPADPPPFLVTPFADPYGADPYPADPYPADPYPADPYDDWASDGRGLAGSRADQLAGPDPDVPVPGHPMSPAAIDDLDDDWGTPGAAGVAAVGAAGIAATRPPGGGRTTPGSAGSSHRPPSMAGPARYDAQRQDARPDGGAPGGRPPAARPQQPVPGRGRRSPEEAVELFGPAWEQPRRYEAYPSLRTRIGLVGLGSIPRLGVAAIGLVLVAVLLFFGAPLLLGIGGGGAGTTKATPTPVATEAPAATPLLTEAPATPHVYAVRKNDTMSKIAKKFGLTIEALMAANPQIKNPDKIQIGDPITIPEPVSAGASSGTVKESAAP